MSFQLLQMIRIIKPDAKEYLYTYSYTGNDDNFNTTKQNVIVYQNSFVCDSKSDNHGPSTTS